MQARGRQVRTEMCKNMQCGNRERRCADAQGKCAQARARQVHTKMRTDAQGKHKDVHRRASQVRAKVYKDVPLL